jgi:(2Fe-2S) ferredoxin
MERIRNASKLEEYRRSLLERPDSRKKVIRICNTGCRGKGSSKVVEAFENQIRKENLQGEVTIRKTGCHGFCEIGSVLVIEPDNILYQRVKPEDVPEIVSETILNGNFLERLLYQNPETGEKILHETEIPFYKNQKKLVSQNTGKIDPTHIEDYLAAGGYAALCKTLTSMTPIEMRPELLSM